MEFEIARLHNDPEDGKLTHRQLVRSTAFIAVGSTVAPTAAHRVAAPVVHTVPDPDDWDPQLSNQTQDNKF